MIRKIKWAFGLLATVALLQVLTGAKRGFVVQVRKQPVAAPIPALTANPNRYASPH